MRVLITGHRGYIGAVMAAVLKNARFEVAGMDCDLYGPCDFGRTRDEVAAFDVDVRDVEFTDLLSFDAVVHLAATPEDWNGALDPTVSEAINRDAAIRLAECCKKAQVGRLLFASTCAVYGRALNELQDEVSATHPLTPYARAKLDAERALLRLSDTSLSVVVMRNATAYGASPRMRLDTAVNEFVASAVTTGRIDMQTEGRAWRPFVHVEDVARMYAAVLAAPNASVSGQVINAVRSDENYRIIDAADRVAELIPGCTRSAPPRTFDRRSYRVDGGKLARLFPRLELHWTLDQGTRQLREAFRTSGLTPGELRSPRFRRIRRLSTLMERGELDSQLRRASALMLR